MGTRTGLLIVGLLLACVATNAAGQTTPRRGWFFTIRAGVAAGRAHCDSPCARPRAVFGPEIAYVLGHSAGDRSSVAVVYGVFGAVSRGQPRDAWNVGGIGLEAATR